MERDQVSTEGVTKQWPIALLVPLGEQQSSVQVYSRLATAISSYAKTQDAYEEPTSVNDQDLLEASFAYSCTF